MYLRKKNWEIFAPRMAAHIHIHIQFFTNMGLWERDLEIGFLRTGMGVVKSTVTYFILIQNLVRGAVAPFRINCLEEVTFAILSVSSVIFNYTMFK